MTLKMKQFVVAAVACACVAGYGAAGVSADQPVGNDTNPTVVYSAPEGQDEAPMVGMPSPIHEFNTVEEAAKYMNITPQLPKVLPVGFNIESVNTINTDILQVVYVYQAGEDASRNQAAGHRINYRISNLKEDISGDYNHYDVTATEKVDGTKVTFKGGKKMVYLATWVKDGQNHAMYFERPVTRDMAKAIIANVAVDRSHTK